MRSFIRLRSRGTRLAQKCPSLVAGQTMRAIRIDASLCVYRSNVVSRVSHRGVPQFRTAHLLQRLRHGSKVAQEMVTMHVAISNDFTNNSPPINFRKKRLTVAIHAQFDMECAQDAAAVKQMID